MKRKGVSKTIWIIIVIVIGSIAALLLVQGFKGSWGSLTDSIGGIADQATKTISGLIPDIGFSLPWGGPGGANTKSCDDVVSELKSKDVSQDKIDKAEQSCEKVKNKWKNIENIVQKVKDASASSASKYVSELKEETKASLSGPETIKKLETAGLLESGKKEDGTFEIDFWLTVSMMKTLGINPSIELPEGGEFYFSIEFVDINLKEKSGRIYPQVYWSPNENVRVGGYLDIYIDLPGKFKLPGFKKAGKEIPSIPIDLEFDFSDFYIEGGEKYKLKPSVGLTSGSGVHIHWEQGEGVEIKEVDIALKLTLETERVG